MVEHLPTDGEILTTRVNSKGMLEANWEPLSEISTALPSTIIYNDKTQTYVAGKKQSFLGDATLAPINVGDQLSADPSSLTNGDIWFSTSSSSPRYQSAGTVKTLADTSTVQTIASKNLIASCHLSDSSDTTKQIKWSLGSLSTGVALTLTPAAITANRTITLPLITAAALMPMTITGRATAQTAANANVLTYTVGASDASFRVSANVLVTASTTHSFAITCAYTDEGNTARTITFNFSLVGGTFQTLVANANGTVPYEGIPLHIRCKAATNIVIAAAAGTYTSVTYNVEGVVQHIA